MKTKSEREREMNITNPQKAVVLVQALPYIRQYNKKIVVVKYGGNAMAGDRLTHQVMEDLVLAASGGG